MKPEKNYKISLSKPYMMFIFGICLVLTLYCFHANAQNRIKRSVDNVYYLTNDKELSSIMSENKEKIMLILSKESMLSDIEGEYVLVYHMKSANLGEIEPGIKLKPYLMIYKSEVNSPDFLKETKEEELKIEEWMFKPEYWTNNGSVR